MCTPFFSDSKPVEAFEGDKEGREGGLPRKPILPGHTWTSVWPFLLRAPKEKCTQTMACG